MSDGRTGHFSLSQSWWNISLCYVLRGYMPSTVTPDDAVSRCSPYCVLKLYLTEKGGEGENGFRRKAFICQFFF